MPEPSTSEGRWVHGELQDLLETAVVQQAESSASRRRGDTSTRPSALPRQDREPSVHDRLRAPSVHDRLSDRRETQGDHDVVSRRHRHNNDGPARGYHPHRGGHAPRGPCWLLVPEQARDGPRPLYLVEVEPWAIPRHPRAVETRSFRPAVPRRSREGLGVRRGPVAPPR